MPSKPSYRARLAAYVIPVGLFVGIAVVAVLLVRGYSFDLQNGLRKTGLVVLDSVPKGAFITLNNRLQPEKTRATLKLNPGTYDLKVDMPGVHPWHKQVRVEPAEAALEEHILLFKSTSGQAALTPGAVPGEALSPSGKELTFLNPAATGPTLSLVRITSGQAEPVRAITALPAEYATPKSLGWSADGSRVLTSAGAETRIITADDGRTVTLPVGGRAVAAPGQSDAAVVESEPGTLVMAAAGNPPTPYETGVTAWTGSGDALYIARGDGTVVRRKGGTDRKVVSHQPVLTELNGALQNGQVYGRDASRTLYRVTEDGLETIATDVDRYAASRDGDQVVYLKQRELRLWDQTKDRDVLLTRFTEPPERLAIIPGGYYVLYGRANELHVIAADGSNDTTLAAGLGLLEVINREQVLVRDSASGRTLSLTILDR